MGHGSYVMGHGSLFGWVSGSWVTGSDPLPTLYLNDDYLRSHQARFRQENVLLGPENETTFGLEAQRWAHSKRLPPNI